MVEPETVRDIAEKETARQAIIFLFTIAGTIGTMWAVHKFSDPDSFMFAKKRTALSVKRFAQRRVDWWQRIADKAATVYHG